MLFGQIYVFNMRILLFGPAYSELYSWIELVNQMFKEELQTSRQVTIGQEN